MNSHLTARSDPANRTATAPGGNIHSRGWMPPLDGLRGLAILMVMLFHYATELNIHSLPQHVVMLVGQFGWTGVDLFFVLSGFLITGILLDSRDAENYLSSFYLRRVLRIFPVYYLSLLVAFLLFPIFLPGIARFSPLPTERIWFFAYLQNWFGLLVNGDRQMLIGHYWSLGIEEQFYMIWPWIVYRNSTKGILKIAIGVSLVSLLLRFVLIGFHVTPELIYRNTFTRMDALVIGAACTCLLREPSCVEYLRRFAPWMWLAPLIALGILRETTSAFGTHSPGVQGLGFTVIALSYAALLVGVVLTMGSRSMLQYVFCSRVMRTFGKYSYAAYIWHQLTRILVLKVEMSMLHTKLPGPINVPLMTMATLVLSMVSFAVVESPFLALKGRFKPRFLVRRPEEMLGQSASAG